MREDTTRARKANLAKALLADSFRVHTVEYRETPDAPPVKRSIEVLEIKDATVLFEVLGGPSKVRHELPYEQFVRINEVRV